MREDEEKEELRTRTWVARREAGVGVVCWDGSILGEIGEALLAGNVASAGEGGADDAVSFVVFLNNLPNRFRLDVVGDTICAGESDVGGFITKECPLDESDTADEPGVASGVPGLLPSAFAPDVGWRNNALVRSVPPRRPPPSGLERCASCGCSAVPGSPQTSVGSRMARSMSSMPRFWNFAILASVPASTMVFVRTLWAWRL